MNRIEALVLFGPPGSGKGTQGRILGAAPGFVHVDMGAVLRGFDASRGIGREIAGYLARGELVPDRTVVRVLTTHLRALEERGDMRRTRDVAVLDGVPRTAAQARALDEHVQVRRIVVLTAERGALAERLAARARAQGREDDARHAVVARRFAAFDAARDELLAVYPAPRVTEVDAVGGPLTVARRVFDAVVDLDPYARAAD